MLTVVIATYNGAATLDRVLSGYARATIPPGGWQLILIDNGSTDESPNIIHRYSDKLPLVYLLENRRGKNKALNYAISKFSGELIVFSDDDAIPAPDFLVQWAETPSRHPGYAMFGGAIRPAWSATPPAWIDDPNLRVDVAYAITPPDQPEGPVEPERIWGPNMAVRREVFELGHRFDEKVGPQGKAYAMGSETSFTIRLAQNGYRGWFLPNIIVEHIIRENQLCRSWVRRRAVNFGRGRFRQHQLLDQADRNLWLGLPRWRLRQLVGDLVRDHLALTAVLLSGDASRIAGAEWRAACARGYLTEFIRNLVNPQS